MRDTISTAVYQKGRWRQNSEKVICSGRTKPYFLKKILGIRIWNKIYYSRLKCTEKRNNQLFFKNNIFIMLFWWISFSGLRKSPMDLFDGKNCRDIVFKLPYYTHFYKHMDFWLKAFAKHELWLWKTTKASMCLKSVLIPDLKWPNLVVEAFCVLFLKGLAKHIENWRLYVQNWLCSWKNQCTASNKGVHPQFLLVENPHATYYILYNTFLRIFVSTCMCVRILWLKFCKKNVNRAVLPTYRPFW